MASVHTWNAKIATSEPQPCLAIDGTELEALGGQVTLDSVSGPDENGDSHIDDDRGAIGQTFFFGCPEGSSSPAHSWFRVGKTRGVALDYSAGAAERRPHTDAHCLYRVIQQHLENFLAHAHEI